jgi:hypothetical protein
MHPANNPPDLSFSIAIPGASSTLIIKKSCSTKTVPATMWERTATQKKPHQKISSKTVPASLQEWFLENMIF